MTQYKENKAYEQASEKKSDKQNASFERGTSQDKSVFEKAMTSFMNQYSNRENNRSYYFKNNVYQSKSSQENEQQVTTQLPLRIKNEASKKQEEYKSSYDKGYDKTKRYEKNKIYDKEKIKAYVAEKEDVEKDHKSEKDINYYDSNYEEEDPEKAFANITMTVILCRNCNQFFLFNNAFHRHLRFKKCKTPKPSFKPAQSRSLSLSQHNSNRFTFNFSSSSSSNQNELIVRFEIDSSKDMRTGYEFRK